MHYWLLSPFNPTSLPSPIWATFRAWRPKSGSQQAWYTRNRWCVAELDRWLDWPFWCTCCRNNLFLGRTRFWRCPSISSFLWFLCLGYLHKAGRLGWAAGRGHPESLCLHSGGRRWCRRVELCPCFEWLAWIARRLCCQIGSRRRVPCQSRNCSLKWTSATWPRSHSFAETQLCHLSAYSRTISHLLGSAIMQASLGKRIWNQIGYHCKSLMLWLCNCLERSHDHSSICKSNCSSSHIFLAHRTPQ